jgi:hypothetical protein
MAVLLLLRNILASCEMPNSNNAPNNVAAWFVLMHDISNVNNLAVFQTKDVANMIKLWNQDAANNNSKLRMGIQKKVEALIWWAANQRRCNLPINMTTWTVQALMSALQRMAIHDNTKAQSVPSELEPGKVETKLIWYTWDEKFENYPAAHIGSATVPLDYVVCRNKDDIGIWNSMLQPSTSANAIKWFWMDQNSPMMTRHGNGFVNLTRK